MSLCFVIPYYGELYLSDNFFEAADNKFIESAKHKAAQKCSSSNPVLVHDMIFRIVYDCYYEFQEI